MYDNYNYPMGADNPDAPWNQKEIPEMDFFVTATFSLMRDVRITTNDYEPVFDDECSPSVMPNTDNTNWHDAYAKHFYTIPELLADLKQRVQEEIKNTSPLSRRYHQLQKTIESCECFDVINESFELL